MGMTSEGQSWRQEARVLGCTIFYASEPNSSYADYGYAPDEEAFQAAKSKNPHWFVLNDARAWNEKYPLMLHHCDCRRLVSATTYNWPKLIAEKRESLEQWAVENRKHNPIVTCTTCIG